MATVEELEALRQGGEPTLLRTPAGLIEGRVIRPLADSVVTDRRGRPTHPWEIDGSAAAYSPDEIEVVRGFEAIKWDIEHHLVNYDGEAAHAYRESIVGQTMVEGKYSRARAEQVVDEVLARARRAHEERE